MKSVPMPNRASRSFYNLAPTLLILCLLASFPASAQELAAIVNDPFYCAADAYNDAGGAAKMNCTSGDITIASVASVTVLGDPASCDEGVDVLTITQLDYSLQQNANSDRYDVIAWISKFGNDPLLPAGNTTSCLATSFRSDLDTDSGALDFMQDIDGDLCTDMTYTAEPQALVGTTSFDVLCNDSDDDGFADIPILISWGNQAAELDCGNTTPDLQPGNKSKCSVNIINTDVSVVQNPNMTIVKTIADVDTAGNGILDAVGDIINYDVVITNTGDVTLTNVNAGDNVAAGFTCDQTVPGATLAPAETLNCTGFHTVTQEDLDAGTNIINQAFALSDQTGLLNDSTSEPVVQAATMTVAKSVTDVAGDGADGVVDAVDDVISYSIVVTNGGNITLNDVTVSDPMLEGFDPAVDCTPAAPAVLAPGASMTCTGTYTATQVDIDGGGPLDNTATATSTEVPTAQDSASVDVAANSSMSVEKTVSNTGSGIGGAFMVGDTILYDITVTNDGDTTLTNVVVNDALAGLIGASCSASLAPGLSCPVNTGSYLVTQGDIDTQGGGDGDIDNTATASSDNSPNAEGSAEAPLVPPAPAMTLDKTITSTGTGAGGAYEAGGLIVYDLTVTNTGNVTLTNVVLNDAQADVNDVVCAASLAPGATCSAPGGYVVTQDDIDLQGGGDGDIDNTATATSDQTAPVEGSAEAPLVAPDPLAPVSKIVTNLGEGTGPAGTFAAGDTILYEITLTNTGNVTLNNALVDDALLGLVDEVCATTLALNESCTVSGSYLVTQVDIDTLGWPTGDGYIHNTAYGEADETEPFSDDAQAPLEPQNPLMMLVKTVTNTGSGPGGTFDAGDTITYGIAVTNTGNVTLTNVVVNDALAGLVGAVCSASLAPGLSCSVDTGTYLVESADITSSGGGDGDIDNTAIASSTESPDAEGSAEAMLAVRAPAVPVPVNDPLALLLMTLMMLAAGWYFRPVAMRK